MDETGIIKLYFARDESAIKETDRTYAAYCTSIAMSLLQIREDTQECVNDTYMSAWERIPPFVPECLRTFLGRLTRNIAIGMYRRSHAKKRMDRFELTFSELEECLPSGENVERSFDAKQLGKYISEWLDSLGEQDRVLFVRRYWLGDKAVELAKKTGMTEYGISRKLARLQESLRKYLEERGADV